MKLQLLILLIPSIQGDNRAKAGSDRVALCDPFMEVYGYLGDNVTLPSGAEPSGNLSKIVWSIFRNTTLIATYRGGQKNLEWIDRYEGRLGLNINSGNLTIHDLTSKDAMEYTVDLRDAQGQTSVKTIRLMVTERLKKPMIETLASKSVNGSCWVVLECSSTDKGVDFSWQVQPPNVAFSTMKHLNGNSAVLSAFLNNTQNTVIFTCNSSRNMGTASDVLAPKCDDDKPQPSPKPDPHSRRRDGVLSFFGGVLGGSLTVLLILFFKEKVFPCKNSA